MNKPLVLILCGDGINCERETAWAFELAGAKTQIVHINDLLNDDKLIDQCQGMAFPGGFSFGDELGSGQLLAIKMKSRLKAAIDRAIDRKIPVIGICNGLQILTKLGLLPDWYGERTVAMAHNVQGHFIDRWVEMKILNNCSIWTNGIEGQTVSVPVRHGEGRFQFMPGRENEIYESLKEKRQIVFQYTVDINGSYEQIAGICDPSGMVLGLMPHPEAVLFEATMPLQSQNPMGETWAQQLFKNAVNYMTQKGEGK